MSDPSNPFAPDPLTANVARQPPGRLDAYGGFGGRSVAAQQSRRFRHYMDSGFGPDDAGALAANPNLDPVQVQKGREFMDTMELAQSFAELDGEEAVDRWEQLSDDAKERLREQDISFDQPEASGLFGVPYVGDMARNALGWAATGATKFNEWTMGHAGTAIGGALEFMEEAADRIVQRPYRAMEYSIRDRGWVSGVWHGLRGYNYDRVEEGENSLRPGTLPRLTEMADGDRDTVDLVRQMSRGWDNEQILTHMGFEKGDPEGQWGQEFAALDALREDDQFRSMLDYAESQKMSPGRALSNFLGFDDDPWISGFTDAAWRIVTDPTLLAGKAGKTVRLARMSRFDNGPQALEDVATALGDVDHLVTARRIREADGVINPLDHGSYFQGLRSLTRRRGLRGQRDFTPEQLEFIMLSDHVLAGTKAGANVNQVMAQYARLRPKNTRLVTSVEDSIKRGEIYDEWTLAASLRDGIALDAMRSGVGRRRIHDGIPGLFMPRLTAGGTRRLQGKLVVNDVIDWSLASPFKLKTGERLRSTDLGAARVWLSETMRRNRGDTQTPLDDFVDLTAAMRDEGFDRDTIRTVMEARLVDELGGEVLNGERPVHAMARALTRDGKLDTDGMAVVEDTLRQLDGVDGEKLVRAFRSAAARYTARFADGDELPYASTLLDDTVLDDNLKGFVAGLDEAYQTYRARIAANKEKAGDDADAITELGEREFYDEVFKDGFFHPTKDVAPDDDTPFGAVNALRHHFKNRSYTFVTDQGTEEAITRPIEYLELLEELAYGAVDDADQVRRGGAIVERLADAEAGETILNAKLRTIPDITKMITRRAIRPFAMAARDIPRKGYIDFADPNAFDDVRRWLDTGVYGDRADELLGRFINAETDAQRRAVMFMTQRQILEDAGVLYDPAHASWVREVLANTQQFYGGGLMIDGTNRARIMAIMPEAQSSTAMRFVSPREIKAHMQRSKFMEILSPRYGKLGIDQATGRIKLPLGVRAGSADHRTLVQRINRFWKPAAVLSPRLILRAGLDEMFTIPAKHGLVGDQGYLRRVARTYTMRAHQRRIAQTMGLDQGMTLQQLRENTELVAGELSETLTARMVADQAGTTRARLETAQARIRSLQDEIAELEAYGLDPDELVRQVDELYRSAVHGTDSLQDISRGLIERGYLAEDRQLWQLSEDELARVLADGDRANLFAARRPTLERARHTTEAGRVTARLADGFLDRLARWTELTDAEMEAAMSFALDPVLQRALTEDITHVGVYRQAREGAEDDFALMGDAEEMGFLRLQTVVGDERGHVDAAVNDELGRRGLVEMMHQAQRDRFMRDVVLPVHRMELVPDTRAVLDDVVPDVNLTAGPVGDPFADDVVDGMFAPAVAAAAEDGDRILANRLRFLALPDDAQRLVWQRLTGEARFGDDTAVLRTFGDYQDNLARLGVSDQSMLSMTEDEYLDFVDWFDTVPERHGWAIAVNDAPIRPGGSVDAASRLRVTGSDGVFYAQRGDLTVDLAGDMLTSDQTGLTGPGMRLTVDHDAKTSANAGVAGYRVSDPDAQVWNLRSTDTLPDQLLADLQDGNQALRAEISDVLERAGLDGGDVFLLDGSNESIRSFLAELPDRIQLLRGAVGDDEAANVAAAVQRHFYDVWADHGVAGFADAGGPGFVHAHDAFRNQGLPDGTRVSLFDGGIVGQADTPAHAVQGRVEMGFAGARYDEQVADWVKLLRGDGAKGNKLARDRKRAYLTETGYWRRFRGHDMMGPDNGVRDVPKGDELVLHVPRRKGDRPELASPREPGRMLDEDELILGSVDPDVASRHLAELARQRGDDIDMWELAEVRIAARTVSERRATRFGAQEPMPGEGAAVADVGPLADRPTEQLLRVERAELDRARLVGDTEEEQLVLTVPDTAAVGRDEAQLRALLAEDPHAAADAALAALVDTVGQDSIARSMLTRDGAAAALRSMSDEIGRTHAVRTAIYDDVAEALAAGRANLPDWFQLAPTDRGAKVFRGKRQRTAAEQFVDELDRHVPGMFSNSHDGAPLYQLLGPVEQRAFNAHRVREYHGPLPKRTIRPKMKPLREEDRGPGWRYSDKAFEKISGGIAELARRPMFQDEYVQALREVRLTRNAGNRGTTHVHMAREERFKELFGDAYEDLMLRYEGELLTAAQADEGAVRIQDLEPAVVDDFLDGYNYVPPAEREELLKFLDAEHELRSVERQLAMQRAVEAVVPYIDDHRIRSQFADMVDDVIPFFYATEQFIKRWARTFRHSPEAFRRLQLYYEGFKGTGRVYQNEQGEDMFEYPLTGRVAQVLDVLVPGMDTGGLVPNVNLVGRTQDMIPGLDDTLRFSAGPAILAPVSALRSFMPVEAAKFEEVLGGERAVGRDLFDVFLPSTLTRFSGFVNWGDDALNSRDAIAAMAYLEANHPELTPGGVDEFGRAVPPTPEEISHYQDRVRHVARILGLTRGLVGLGGPAAPRIDLDPDNLNQEYVELLDAGLPVDQAVGEFLARYPDATAYTIFTSESESGAPVDPTADVLTALEDNREFYESYTRAGPWLLPYDHEGGDEFSQAAWSELMAMDYRNRKDGDQWYEDFKFAQGAALYFPSSDAKDRMLANAGSTQRREQIRQAWRLWRGDFEARHPLFMRELSSQEGVHKRRDIRTQMRNALADPALPDVPQQEVIKELMLGWDALQTVLTDHLSYDRDTRTRAAEAFHVWARQQTAGDFMTQAFYDRAMLRDIEISAEFDEAVTAQLPTAGAV